MASGRVKWFSNQTGYGFISLLFGSDEFVHYNAMQGDGYRALEQDQEVEFEIQNSPKGQQAVNVIKV